MIPDVPVKDKLKMLHKNVTEECKNREALLALVA